MRCVMQKQSRDSVSGHIENVKWSYNCQLSSFSPSTYAHRKLCALDRDGNIDPVQTRYAFLSLAIFPIPRTPAWIRSLSRQWDPHGSGHPPCPLLSSLMSLKHLQGQVLSLQQALQFGWEDAADWRVLHEIYHVVQCWHLLARESIAICHEFHGWRTVHGAVIDWMALTRVERKRRCDQVSCKFVLAHKAYIPNFTFDPVAPCIFSEYVMVLLILPANFEVPREFWLLPRPFELSPICSVIQWRDPATTILSSYLKGRKLTREPNQLLSVRIEDIATSYIRKCHLPVHDHLHFLSISN